MISKKEERSQKQRTRLIMLKKFAGERVNFPEKEEVKVRRKEKQVFHIYINDVNCLKSSGASLSARPKKLGSVTGSLVVSGNCPSKGKSSRVNHLLTYLS